MWVKQKDRLLGISAKAGRFHLMHNRYIRFLDLERDLMNWINQSRNNGACVSGKCIQLKALNLARQSGLEHFRASKGWLVRFLNRNNLVLRRITSKGRSLPSNCVETINTFIDKCQEDNANRPRSHIYNFDETSIYLDSTDNYTYEVRGSKRVKVDTSGNEKTRISIGLCASADVTKLPLIIIVSRKTPFKNFDVPSNVHLVYKPKATFDSACVKYEFIQRILLSHLIKSSQKKPNLYLDQAPCHKNPDVTNYMRDLNIDYSFIPPRITSLLQPADVSWLKSFKKSYIEKWSNWYLKDFKSFTKNGNLKSPGYEQAIK